MSAAEAHDSASDVADAITALGRPLLLVFDCDGVLAPLTDHADDSTLTDGVGSDLRRLAGASSDVTVAILSGRSLAGLEQFEFADDIAVSGSYGGERRGATIDDLTADEQRLLAMLDEVAVDAADAAGTGAWVERKPTSVVIHVREADPDRSATALDAARRALASVAGPEIHEGSNVLELMARPTDKGRGLLALRSEFGAAGTVYVGDDVPDEDAFEVLGEHDVSIKVGSGPTIATHRLEDPASVARLLGALVRRLDAGPVLTASEQR